MVAINTARVEDDGLLRGAIAMDIPVSNIRVDETRLNTPPTRLQGP